MKTVAHAILSPYAVHLHVFVRVRVWVHIPGDPSECSAEERYNNLDSHCQKACLIQRPVAGSFVVLQISITANMHNRLAN